MRGGKLNILYHHRTQGKGVERVHILGIVNSWRKGGHEVDIVSPPGVSLDDRKNLERDQKNNHRTWKRIAKYAPEFLFELLEVGYNLWAFIVLSRKIRIKRYDLLFERYSLLCLAGLVAAKCHSLPFLLEVNYTSYTPIVRRRTFISRVLEHLVERVLFRKVDGIVAVSSYLKGHLIEMGVRENKILVLPNAADPAKFNPEINGDHVKAKWGLQRNKIVGFVGYFHPWHGIEFLLETYTQVRKEVEEVIYLLVGQGPVYEKMCEVVKRKGLDEKILLVGNVSHEKISKYIGAFDIAVMPHSNVYGSPMKIPEYMAMGKVVVAPRLGPIEDIIQDGKNGLLFEPGNQEQFIQRVSTALMNDELRNAIGKAARLSILEKHNWQTNSEKILDLYAQVITTKSIKNQA